MKTKSRTLAYLISFGVLITVIVIVEGCNKSSVKPTTSSTTTTTTTTTTTDTTKKPDTAVAINLIGLRSDSGFAYKLGYHLPISGDTPDSPKVSKLHLYENGVALGPAHSEHEDIRKYGLGQYSHWGTELIFSTSDNSNPLTNGRKYTYNIK